VAYGCIWRSPAALSSTATLEARDAGQCGFSLINKGNDG
jgi:hypothetical protein